MAQELEFCQTEPQVLSGGQGCQRDTFSAFSTLSLQVTPCHYWVKKGNFLKKGHFLAFFQNQYHMYLFSVFSLLQLLLICALCFSGSFSSWGFFLSYPHYFPFQKRENSNVVKHVTCSRQVRKKKILIKKTDASI